MIQNPDVMRRPLSAWCIHATGTKVWQFPEDSGDLPSPSTCCSRRCQGRRIVRHGCSCSCCASPAEHISADNALQRDV